MKKSLRIASAMAILLAGYSQSLLAQTNYYWSNAAGGSWHTPGNWRTGTANGPVALSAPTRNDDVFITTSFPSAATIAVTQASAARSLTYNVTNRAITLHVNAILEIAGSLLITNGTSNNKLNITTTLTAAQIAAGNVALRFTAPLTTPNAMIRSWGANPTIFDVPVVFDGADGKWILQDNMTVGLLNATAPIRNVSFVNGHVVALPLSVTNPLNPNGSLPPTDPTTRVTNSPRFVFNTTATVSGAQHGSHVIGYVQKVVVKDTPGFEFPIGDGTYYRPFVTEQAKSGNNLLARYLSIAPVKRTISPNPEWSRIDYTTPLNGVSDKEFWYFDAPDNSSPGIKINATHPSPAVAEYMRLDKWMGLTVAGLSTSNSNPPLATWFDLNARPVAASYISNPVTMTLNAGVTEFWVSAGGASNSNNWITFGRRGVTSLPVRLVSFTGQQLEGQVQLKWQSSSEENTSHFEVEKSADGKNFSPVLTKKAQGNSSSLVSYNAIDNSPLSGTSYYRLKMVDLDGTFEYSKLVAVSAEGTLQVLAYPNPSQGNGINLIAGDGSKLVLKSVSDLFGKTVGYQQRSTGESLQVNFAQPLPAGFYVATLAGSDNGALVKVKFVVQ